MKKRIISLVLAMVMCLSVAACGGGKKPNSNSEANNKASKEGVFDVVDMEAIGSSDENGEYNIYQVKVIGDTLHMIANVYLPNGNQIRYITADLEGNVKTDAVVYEDIWEETSVDDGMGVAPRTEEAVELPIEKPGAENVWHNVYGHQILSDGKLAYVDNYETYDMETGMNSNTVNIGVCDVNGTELFTVCLNEGLDEGKYVYVNSLVESDSNTVFALSYENIFEIDLQGKLVGTYELNDVTSDLDNVEFYKDGYPVFAKWNEDWTKRTFKAIDLRAGVVVEELAVMDALANYTINDGTNSGYDLVLTNNMGVYGYNFGDTDVTLIMDYINSNLATYRVNYICFKDSEHFIGIYNDAINYDSHVASFTKVAPENVPDRKTLTMAVYGAGSDVTKAVIDYNKTSDTYKILIKDYAQYSTYENWQAGYERLNNEIVSGNVPDIIQCSAFLPVANYATKGLLVDFYELMEKDDTINREDYAENVFRAYETEGKLYELPIMFYISTVYGKTDIWGEEPGITWDDVAAVQAKYPEAVLFSEMTKEGALNNSLMYSYGQLVDEVTGECHFDSEMFKSLLEYANTYPAEINYDELYSDDNYWLTYQTQYIDDRTLLMQSTFYTVYEAWLYSKQSFNADVTPVGFPTDEGQGSVISATSSYAISAKSDYIDGAWDFVKSFISEEKQTIPEDGDRYSMWGLPILKKGIEQQADYITKKPYYKDENGQKVEYSDSIWINNEQIEIEPADQAERQKWIDFIYSVDKKMAGGYDKAMEIISEEVEPYFAGQKSVEDVMTIVQSRMNIFISEGR